VRLYLDEDLGPLVARLLRGKGIDAVSVHELGLTGYPDAEHLDRAAREGRCVVTANRDDFLRLTAERLARGEPHAGVLVIAHTLRVRSPAALAGALARYQATHPDGLAPYAVDILGIPWTR
jgi:predicted nuclease of predicted toxin-antitoxin system